MAEQTTHSNPLISLNKITLRLGDRLFLPETSWSIETGQHWAVLGPNGSGKSSLVGAIAGIVPVARGRLIYHFSENPVSAIGYVSFSLHQHILSRDMDRDEARYFSGNIDQIQTVHQLLTEDSDGGGDVSDRIGWALSLLGISHLDQREIRNLSTGEMRKCLIARALLKGPKLLILDEPFDGLDSHSKSSIQGSISDLIASGFQIVLVTHRMDELIPDISHVLCLKQGTVIAQGDREAVFETIQLNRLYDQESADKAAVCSPSIPNPAPSTGKRDMLIVMKGATVRYGGKAIIDGLDWTVRQHEQWAIVGPNGAGKSTLLKLIIGDNLQVYSNKVTIFGKKRGSGESVWEIKNKIGYISSEFQLNYRKRISALEVVLSGFFDSVGLYRLATDAQIESARQWMRSLNITDLEVRRFDSLSDGEKRLVLIARILVKSPILLIMDEPCQGLDPTNRRRILELIDSIGRSAASTLLYVTHHADEIPPCMTHLLEFKRQPANGSEYRAVIQPLNR